MSGRRTSRIIPKGIPFGMIPHDMTLDPNVTNAGHRVYALLMKLANSESRAWPGQRYIEDALPMTRKTVATALANLETTGWIVVDRSLQSHKYFVAVELGILELDWSSNDSGVISPPGEDVPRTGVETPHEPGEKLLQTDNYDREPIQTTNIAERNIAFEFLTDPTAFGLPSKTRTQNRRVGKLARELNASIDIWKERERKGLPAAWMSPDVVETELRGRASRWSDHFDVVMTADAFVKHFELLGAAPLKMTKSEATRRNTLAAVADLESPS